MSSYLVAMAVGDFRCLDATEDGVPIRVCATPDQALRDVDAAIVGTACPEFAAWNWTALCRLMRQPVVVDGRGALEHVAWPADARYLTIGRVAAATRTDR